MRAHYGHGAVRPTPRPARRPPCRADCHPLPTRPSRGPRAHARGAGPQLCPSTPCLSGSPPKPHHHGQRRPGLHGLQPVLPRLPRRHRRSTGGSIWPGSWRLPHTFLCPRHQRPLDWRCPQCQAPAFSNGYRTDGRWRPTQLTPAPRSRLHPARCRHRLGIGQVPACGYRLDQPSATGNAPTAAMAHTQQRLTEAARSVAGQDIGSLGRPTSPQRFLNDVRAVTLIICSTWPTAAETLRDVEHLDAVAAHADTRNRAATERAGPPEGGWLARSVDRPPGDPLRAAALMTLVVRILDAPDGQTALARSLSRLPSNGAAYRRLQRLTPTAHPA